MPHENPKSVMRADRPGSAGAAGNRFPGHRRAATSAFTLIELLVVIAIIITLAGLVLAAVGGMQKNAARKKTITQINAIDLGLEMFHRDNGEFPINEGSPEEGAEVLYQALSGDGNNRLGFYGDSKAPTGKLGSSGTVYLEELDPQANPQGLVGRKGSTYLVVDPWGQSYHYIRYADADDRRSRQRNVATFDLYSIGPEGKDEASSEYKWLTNWD